MPGCKAFSDAQGKGTWEVSLASLVCQEGVTSATGCWRAPCLHHKMAICLPSVPCICSLFLFPPKWQHYINFWLVSFSKKSQARQTFPPPHPFPSFLCFFLPSPPPFPGHREIKIVAQSQLKMSFQEKPEKARAHFLCCCDLAESLSRQSATWSPYPHVCRKRGQPSRLVGSQGLGNGSSTCPCLYFGLSHIQIF